MSTGPSKHHLPPTRVDSERMVWLRPDSGQYDEPGSRLRLDLESGDSAFLSDELVQPGQVNNPSARRTNRVRAIHAKIANIRRDHHHKLSTTIVREHGAIFVGNVSSSQLRRTKMAKSITDAGWSSFRNMLRYKASRHGARYAEVDECFTSQTCSSCGALPPTRPKGIAGLGIRAWQCLKCGTVHDRDVNAARNIRQLGRSATPPAEGSWIAQGGIP